jgi:hypothetical protein
MPEVVSKQVTGGSLLDCQSMFLFLQEKYA